MKERKQTLLDFILGCGNGPIIRNEALALEGGSTFTWWIWGQRSVLSILLLSGVLSCGAIAPNEPAEELHPASSQGSDELWLPSPEGWVTDLAGVLPVDRKTAIVTQPAAHEAATMQEFAVLIIDGLRGEAVEDFSLRVARAWGIGKEGMSNGLLIVIALQERRCRIEVADGPVDSIPDELAMEVMERDMLPALREGRHADAIEESLRSLMEASR